MRLLIIEDEIEINELLKKGLQKYGFQVDAVLNGTDGLNMLEMNQYDTLLLDLNLPDMDGLDIVTKLRNENIMLPIIIISARNTISDKALGLDLGADDYIQKPFDFVELNSRINAVIRRMYGRSNPNISVGNLVLLSNSRNAKVNDLILDLSAKEYDLLNILCLNYPNIVSAEDIIAHIYDDSFDPFSSVLRVHMLNLRKKLQKANCDVGIETIKGVGYRLCLLEKE